MPDKQPAAVPEPQAARDRVVLHYTGDESGLPYAHGIPARDLTESDIARLVYIDTNAPDKPGLAPEAGGFAKARDAKVEQLAGLPFYRKTPKE